MVKIFALLKVSAVVTSKGSISLIIEKRSLGKVTILDVEGAIKLGQSAEFFSQTLDSVLRNEKTNVIIDFSDINYIDSTGMGELIGYLSKFSGQNRQVVLIKPSGRILKLLKIVRLDKAFKIFPDENSAVAYAEKQSES